MSLKVHTLDKTTCENLHITSTALQLYNLIFIHIKLNNIHYGGVAHLGERYNGIVEVVGSSPIVSTKTRLLS